MDALLDRFSLRWKNLVSRSKLRDIKLPNKEELYNKILDNYRSGFKCEYCDQKMLIKDSKPPYSRSFSLDHKQSLDLGGTNDLNNFAIVCTRCNMIKSTMSDTVYRALIKPHLSNKKLLENVYKEVRSGRLGHKLERTRNSTLSRSLQQLETRVNLQKDQSFISWLVPRCPKCKEPLGSYLQFKPGEPDLTCIKCKTNYKIEEFMYDD